MREGINITLVHKIIEKKQTVMAWACEEKGRGQTWKKTSRLDKQGRQPTGRPRKRWIQGIEDTIQRRGGTL